MAVGATVVWKALSFINALLVAAYFGVSAETDVYYYILTLGGILVALMHTFNTGAIIPEIQVHETRRPGSGQPLLNFFLLFYVALAALLITLGLLCPVGLVYRVSRFTLGQLTPYAWLLFIGFFLCAFQLLTQFLTAILEMYHRFSAALLYPLNAICPLVCLLLLGKKIGVISMMYGFALSYFCQAVILFCTLKYEMDWHFRPQKVKFSRRFLHNLGSLQIQSLLALVASLLPMYLLSGYASGLVSALNYAKQLSDTLSEILTNRVANLTKIQFTEQLARHQWDRLNDTFLAVNHFLIFILAPVTIFSCFYAPEILTVFFKRGVFTAQDVHMAAGFLIPLLLVTLLGAYGMLQWAVFSALRKLRKYLPYSLVSMLLLLVSLPLTMRLWGAYAYPYTQLGCNLVGVLMTLWFFCKYAKRLENMPAIRACLRLISLNIIALVPSAVYGWFFAGSNPWITLFCGGIIYVSALTALCYYSGDLQFFLRQCLPQAKI